MLKLTEIKKNYLSGENEVHALKGVSINFREKEFVSILGPSGCGKTTLLNIIGGLDHYTSGDLVINGVSTKEYNDRNWDTYRNHSIGFVFQSYNLIPHQSVLANVELALTLSGVGKAERRERAKNVLEKVGLGDQLNKRPNQLSGGQMQRVAIARALVNNPDILLADEPTGALDTETSVQIMELLKEVASEKLVIMVTHNPELAEKYSTRIIRLLDGNITDDSMPYTDEEIKKAEKKSEEEAKKAEKAAKKAAKKEKTSMGFATALALSFNNLMTKKGRTILTAFAGSIGIIGIALILSLSNGIQCYIDQVEEETLSSYPIVIEREVVDMSSTIEAMMGVNDNIDHENDKIYSRNVMTQAIQSMVADSSKNDLNSFKQFLDTDEEIADITNGIMYSYNINPVIYYQGDGENLQVSPFAFSGRGNGATSVYYSRFSTTWSEMLDNEELLNDQYEMVEGRLPENANEVILVVDKYNQISDLTLYALGFRDTKELMEMIYTAIGNLGDSDYAESIESEDTTYEYDEIIGRKFKLVLPCDRYSYDATTNSYVDMSNDKYFMENVIENGEDITIVGIIRIRDDVMTSTMQAGTIAYTHELTEKYITAINKCDLIKAQLADQSTNVLTGKKFEDTEGPELTDSEKAKLFMDYVDGITPSEKASLLVSIYSTPDQAQLDAIAADYINQYPDRESQIQYILDRSTEIINQLKTGEIDISDFEYFGIKNIDEQTLNMVASMTEEEMRQSFDQAYSNMSDEDIQNTFLQYITMSVYKEYAVDMAQAYDTYSNEELAGMLDEYLTTIDDAGLAVLYDKNAKNMYSDMSYDEVCALLGICDLNEPNSISIYVKSFDDKERFKKIIEEYNEKVGEEGEINYTDYVGIMMSGISKIVNVISYILIAFVSISLVVSSIMIGIITYISVLERTKEIGILRAVGASKRDIRHVFNSEAIIIGFVSGFIGIMVTVLLNIPISIIVKKLTDVPNIAKLPIKGGIILVLISMFLTFIAGLIPSSVAAKKDPVIALRTE